MRRLLDRHEHATDQLVELKLGKCMLHFVNEQMRLFEMRSVSEYISKLVNDERNRAVLQNVVQRQQAEIRKLATLRRQSRRP